MAAKREMLVFWTPELAVNSISTGPNSPRIRKMIAGYKLHELDDQGSWRDVAIFTRKCKVAPIPREDGRFQDAPVGDG